MQDTQLKNETLEAKFDPELGIVINTFPNKISTSDFIAKCNSALEKLAANQCDKLIADTTDLGVMGNEKQEFIQQEWFPKALGSGLKRLAFVVPKDTFGRFGIEKANKEAEGLPIDMKYFGSRKEAIAWIKR
ncbi:MAG: STAS/SEC14 domain-containing protein [Bacteroidota bacterium]